MTIIPIPTTKHTVSRASNSSLKKGLLLSSNGAAASLPVKPESLARAGSTIEDQAQQLIMDKLWNFATTRSLRYRLLNNADLVMSGKENNDGNFGIGKSNSAFEYIYHYIV